MSTRHLIVGAGIFGLTAALELRRRGDAVQVIDPGPLPSPLAASTDITKAVRMDYGADEGLTALADQAIVGWRAWNARWPAPLYHPTGVVYLRRTPMIPGTFEWASADLLSRRGVAIERLDAHGITSRWPLLAGGGLVDGYFNPRGGWVAAARVVARLAEDARAEGVTFRVGVAARSLAMAGGRVTGVITRAGETIEADSVVVAAGAWTPRLLPWLRGYLWTTAHPVLHFRPRGDVAKGLGSLPTWALEVAETGFYGFPLLPDGTLKVARHAEGQAGAEASARPPGRAVEQTFRSFLDAHLAPVVQGPRVGGRWCRYCDTLDGDFWIGRDPARPGLTVAAGGAGHGFKFAPLLGALIADAVEGAQHPRFGWRPDRVPGIEAARAPVPT